MTAVLALDLSLTATGVAHTDGEPATLTPPKGVVGMERLNWISTQAAIRSGHGFDEDGSFFRPTPAVVAIEGYAYARPNQAHQIGELGGCVRLTLWNLGQPYIDVPPKVVKKYATGKGNAGKPEVLVEAVKRLGYDGADDNEADALWLRALVLDALGEPVVKVPESHRDVLAKVEEHLRTVLP